MRFNDFSKEWKVYTFDEIASYKKGPFGSALKKDLFVPKTKESVKVYEQQNVINKDFHLERYFISADYYQKMKPFTVYPGDTIVSCAGTIGELYTLPDDADIGVINQALMIIRNKEDIVLKDFLNIQFSRMIEEFSNTYSNGSAIKNIPPFSDLKKKKTFIPNKIEQRKILDFINLVDQKIDTQSKIINDYNSLKKGIIQRIFSPSHQYSSVHLKTIIKEVSRKNKSQNNKNVLSVSNSLGFIKQSEQFEDREIASSDTSNYKIVNKNEYAYNPARINVGSIARLQHYDCGIVSPMYTIFKIDISKITYEYFDLFIHSYTFKKQLSQKLEGSVRQCLTFSSMQNILIDLPPLETQIEISENMKFIDSKIKIESNYLNLLKIEKDYLLKNMFI